MTHIYPRNPNEKINLEFKNKSVSWYKVAGPPIVGQKRGNFSAARHIERLERAIIRDEKRTEDFLEDFIKEQEKLKTKILRDVWLMILAMVGLLAIVAFALPFIIRGF